MTGFIVHQSVKYKEVHLEKLEDVFDISLAPIASGRHQQNKTLDMNNKVIVCTGNPGVGKTTICKTLLMKWASSNDISASGILQFKLVCYIPIREAQQERIVDILDSFNLVDDYCRPFLHWVLTKFAEQILFILDGIDEVEIPKESELWKLIQNKIYDGSTILVTSRPQAKVLQEMGYSPKVKVFLEGTDEDSAKLYIKQLDFSDQAASGFMRLCKTTIGDKLLQIPMYVVFLLFSISDDEDKNGLFAQHVPETLTGVLSSFIITLVKRWLARMGRSKDMIAVKSNSPLLGRNSPLPQDIQRILYLIGKLCYESILSGKYEFSEENVGDTFLSIDDLNKSGLFSVVNNKKQKQLSVLHRIVHEYLAGLYIGSEQFESSSFSKMIGDSYFVYSLGQNRMLSAVQFAVGVCPSLLEKMFEQKQSSSHRVVQSSSDRATDIYYEASLLGEASSESLYVKFLHLLVNSEILQSGKLSFVKRFIEQQNVSPAEETTSLGSVRVYETHLTKLIKRVDCKCSSRLLTKFYDVVLQETSGNEFLFKLTESSVVNSICNFLGRDMNTLNICLDQLSAELLAKLVVRQVHCLKVRTWNRAFLDIHCLMASLPDLKAVDITAVPVDCSVQFQQLSTCVDHNSRLEKISLFSAGESCIVPKHASHTIVSQKQLKSLALLFCDILSEAEGLDKMMLLQDLTEVILFDNMFTNTKLRKFCSLIKSSTKLQKLTLWAVFIEEPDISPLVKQMENCTCLEMLSIHIGPPENIQMLVEVLPKLTLLKHFSVHCHRISGVEEQVVTALCHCCTLQTFTVWNYDGELKTTEYTFPENLKKDLQLHHIELKVKSPGELQTWDDFLQMYYDF